MHVGMHPNEWHGSTQILVYNWYTMLVKYAANVCLGRCIDQNKKKKTGLRTLSFETVLILVSMVSDLKLLLHTANELIKAALCLFNERLRNYFTSDLFRQFGTFIVDKSCVTGNL